MFHVLYSDHFTSTKPEYDKIGFYLIGEISNDSDVKWLWSTVCYIVLYYYQPSNASEHSCSFMISRLAA